MRVIAGTYRSRVLKSLKGNALRPTSDRLRETLFNILGSAVDNCRFIDVFAGTGAVGIEALSRGASQAVFIESHAPAATLIRRNMESLGISSQALVLPLDAIRGLEKLTARNKASNPPFDFVFLDPPYARVEEYTRVLHFLASAPFLRDGSVVIAEHSRKVELPAQTGKLGRTRTVRQGDVALTFFRLLSPERDA
jgi:16S rRNA (guanine(966)-N(2))-methyltransferase RsmD